MEKENTQHLKFKYIFVQRGNLNDVKDDEHLGEAQRVKPELLKTIFLTFQALDVILVCDHTQIKAL